MAKLQRLTGKLFGGTATATGDNPQIGQFGSGLAGTYVGTTDVASIQNLAAWSNGFIGSVTPTTQYPPLPEMTGFGKVLSYQENYILQQGVPEWDSATDYHVNGFCSYNGVIYRSKTNNNVNKVPSSNASNWEVYITPTTWGEIAGTLSNQTDLKNALDGKASTGLDNLDSLGGNRLHALKSYEDDGELLTDAEGLVDVKDYAHSTFDRSKFTVTGSPIITSDGIASGCTSNDYVTMPVFTTNGNDFVYKFSYTTPATLPTTGSFAIIGGNNTSNRGAFQAYWSTLAADMACFVDNEGTQVKVNTTISVTWEASTEYDFIISKTGTTYKFGVKKATESSYTYGTDQTSSYPLKDSSAQQIGHSSTFIGSVNLKKVSLTVGGIPVFSGNKTGIDTIKPDDYTVVGTPTISDDGILSDCNASDYIKFPVMSTNGKDFIFEGQYTTPSTLSANGFMIIGGNDSAGRGSFQFYYNTDNKLNAACFVDNSGTQVKLTRGLDVTWAVNTTYDFCCVKEGTSYSFGIKKSTDTTYTMAEALTSEYPLLDTSAQQIGNAANFVGSVNLNAYKWYIGGDLVYQPCLKIPYTETANGAKVADAIYRDRVADAYNQGYIDYKYYTLSDTNFTLPMGDIYGMIENKLDVVTADATKRSKVIAWGMPDYSTAITTGYVNGSANSYTVPYDCLCIVQDEANATGTHDLNINGTNFTFWYNSDSAYLQIPYGWFLLSKGDIVYTNVSAKLKIIKLKGVA